MRASRSWGRVKYVLYCRVSVARQPAGDVCVSYSRANSCPRDSPITTASPLTTESKVSYRHSRFANYRHGHSSSHSRSIIKRHDQLIG